jgi:polysaccharide export outer membrane protein
MESPSVIIPRDARGSLQATLCERARDGRATDHPGSVSVGLAWLVVWLCVVTGLARAQETPLLTIGPGDVLEVSVLGVDELSKKVRVLGDGTVTLPLLGNVSVAGLTVREVEAEIARTLADGKLVNDPQVSIFVAESVSGSVTVQGAVAKPGVYALFGQRTLLEVLGQAGGLNRERGADILVLRRAEAGQQESLQIDATRLVEEGDVSLNIQLRPGDIVMVPVARSLRVYVTGAVSRPGAVEYSSSEGITVLQAVTAAGGPTERANLKNVTLRRRRADGTEESREINLKKIQKGKAPDVPLERNDTIVVGEWLL